GDAYREAVRSARVLLCTGEEQCALAAGTAPAATAVVLPDDRRDPRWTAALAAALAPLGMAVSPRRRCATG
ncbi:MAG: hypothetical protein JWL78_573, partial [Chloroflexi bacterium]|nr:hypothetical protein [Chloroflexota bacterium]